MTCPDTRGVTVYTLSSSRDGAVRYVGQTVQPISARFRQHINNSKNNKTPVARWIKRELEHGYSINITPLEMNAMLHVAEMSWIARFRADGTKILNLTDGGEGTLGWHGNLGNKRPDLAEKNRLGKGKPGHVTTQETKDKISAAKKGMKSPWVSERNRQQAGKPGRAHTKESRAKISAAHKGRIMDAEWRANISASRKGRKLAPEAIAKLRAGHKAYYERKRNGA